MNRIARKMLEKSHKEYRGVMGLTTEELASVIGDDFKENIGWDRGVNFKFVHLKWRRCKGSWTPTDYTPNGQSTKLHQLVVMITDAGEEDVK
jgi:hypothetical protein